MTTSTSASAFPPAPATASTCPKCGASAAPATAIQTCACGTRFVLRYGTLSDPHVQLPAVVPQAQEMKLRAPGMFVVSQAVLKPDAIGFGALDPILGRFPMDEKGVRFAHLYSVAIWREINVAQLVTFIVISLPLAIMSIIGVVAAKGEPPALICLLPMLAIAAFHGYRTFVSKATRMRVVGFKDRTLDISFTGGMGKRIKFVDEFFRRSGLTQTEVP